MCRFPVDDFCKLVCLMDTGRNQNLLCVPESESFSLKIRAYFDTIHYAWNLLSHISYWRVKSTAIPVSHMAAVRSWLLGPHARADVIVCAKHHQPGDRSLSCTVPWILLATGIGSLDVVEQFFTSRHSGTSCKSVVVVIYRLGTNYVAPLSVMTSRLPGSLKQTRGSGCLSWQPNNSARFRLGHILWPLLISSLLVLMQSSFYNLKTHLCWQKHYNITNISVQV